MPPRSDNWERADVYGRLRIPKLASDAAKLRDLFLCCQAANLREVRALVTHHPYLLSLTDNRGFSALHYAQLSDNAGFLAELLELYRHPEMTIKKLVVYHTESEFEEDVFRGLEVLRYNPSPGSESRAAVVQVSDFGPAAEAGVLPGDTLEGVLGVELLSSRQPPPVEEPDILQGIRFQFTFPLTLEFRGGSLGAEVLGTDGWTPSHAAAALHTNNHQKDVLKVLLSMTPGSAARGAMDAGGRTPLEWFLMERAGHDTPGSASPHLGSSMPPPSPTSASFEGGPLMGHTLSARDSRLRPRPAEALRRPLSANSHQGGTHMSCSLPSSVLAPMFNASTSRGLCLPAAFGSPGGTIVPSYESSAPAPPLGWDVPVLSVETLRSLPSCTRKIQSPQVSHYAAFPV